MVLYVSDLAPGEGDLGGQSIVLLVNVQPKGIHSHPQLRTLLILGREKICILCQGDIHIINYK